MLFPTAATQRSLCWKLGGGEAVALFGGWLPLAETLERVAIPEEGGRWGESTSDKKTVVITSHAL